MKKKIMVQNYAIKKEKKETKKKKKNLSKHYKYSIFYNFY